MFTTAPTVGDLLLVGMGYAGTKHPSGAPAGWTQLDDLEVSTNAWLTTYYHIVGAAEANSYTFTTTGGDFLGIVGFDVTGQATTAFINQHAANTATSANTQTTSSVTPSVLGTLAISFYAMNDGSGSVSTPAGVSAGWLNDQNPQPTFHSMAGGHKVLLTTDTTTPINVTWQYDTVGGGVTNSVASINLIAPATATVNKGSFLDFM